MTDAASPLPWTPRLRYRLLKRAMDYGCVLPTLPAWGTTIAVLAVLVRWQSAGPAFFVQTRVGRHGRPLRVYKLRTMAHGAPGPGITASNDPRITALGAWLRRTKLDELPQLWNVLRGDMSLVGPRPEAPQYVDLEEPAWQVVLSVRPGITDLSSWVFRHEESLLARAHDPERAYRNVILPAKLTLALSHIERQSLWYDITTIWRTLISLGQPCNDAHPVWRATRARLDAQLGEQASCESPSTAPVSVRPR